MTSPVSEFAAGTRGAHLGTRAPAQPRACREAEVARAVLVRRARAVRLRGAADRAQPVRLQRSDAALRAGHLESSDHRALSLSDDRPRQGHGRADRRGNRCTRLQMPWPWNYGAHARALDAHPRLQAQGGVVDFPVRRSAHRRHAAGSCRRDRALQEGRRAALFRRRHRSALWRGAAAPRTRQHRRSDPRSDASNVYDGVVRQYPTSGHCYRTERTRRRHLPVARVAGLQGSLSASIRWRR